MTNGLKGKSVVIIGATGGLGSCFAKAFAEYGAKLLLVGRNVQKLDIIASHIAGDISVSTVDITNEESVEKLVEYAQIWSPQIDIIVNASGTDVRKSLAQHNYHELRRTLDINLLGSILITKAFIPLMRNQKGSMIVHVGGFADGRLAFPYYSVDVASRAGLYTFIESINRELKLEGYETRVSFFSPSPTNTDAEKPFHPLWIQMGISIVPIEKVVEALLRSIEKKKRVCVMGGVSTILFSILNALSSTLADVIMMNKYGKMLKKFLLSKREDLH